MKILLVKLSSLGDVVHTLPVVQDILAARPGAQIDWVVERSFAPLLSPLRASGHLQHVIPCELRRWRKAPLASATRAEWRTFKKQLQAVPYDAVIDLQGLTKSALVARLARLAPDGKRYALANQTEGSAYEAPTRWVADVAIAMAPHIHAMQRGRELCARALGYALPPVPDFGLKVPSAHMKHAQDAPEIIAFVHGTSRADKQWPLENWVRLGRQLIAHGYRIALPHGSTDELATSQAIAAGLNADGDHNSVERGGSPSSRGRGTGFAGPQAQRPLGWHPSTGSGRTEFSERGGAIVWPRLPLDALTQQLAQCVGVIGVDSGLSHIAVALDLPHVQIYNFDTAWRTGPLPVPTGSGAQRQLSVFARPTPSVQTVWDAWLSCQPLPAQVSEWAPLP
ncbi:lipopolysaccharide heptosyltransferase I [Polaromonas sp. AER18D-145]|uniref:lipopolysaccharide heptosyltransferase I n=1 Tax=Polaromonas sp. AER18D-145 TaxID=1977060 RepID=UPI001F0AAC1B|nr:lipopolysaccharide heptosyltransferase I [Polaromonas sp. AER18D-145]